MVLLHILEFSGSFRNAYGPAITSNLRLQQHFTEPKAPSSTVSWRVSDTRGRRRESSITHGLDRVFGIVLELAVNRTFTTACCLEHITKHSHYCLAHAWTLKPVRTQDESNPHLLSAQLIGRDITLALLVQKSVVKPMPCDRQRFLFLQYLLGSAKSAGRCCFPMIPLENSLIMASMFTSKH